MSRGYVWGAIGCLAIYLAVLLAVNAMRGIDAAVAQYQADSPVRAVPTSNLLAAPTGKAKVETLQSDRVVFADDADPDVTVCWKGTCRRLAELYTAYGSPTLKWYSGPSSQGEPVPLPDWTDRAPRYAPSGPRQTAFTPVQKWYITGGHTETGIRDDCHVPPLVGYGADSIEAVADSGITVWRAERWKELEPMFLRTCR